MQAIRTFVVHILQPNCIWPSFFQGGAILWDCGSFAGSKSPESGYGSRLQTPVTPLLPKGPTNKGWTVWSDSLWASEALDQQMHQTCREQVRHPANSSTRHPASSRGKKEATLRPQTLKPSNAQTLRPSDLQALEPPRGLGAKVGEGPQHPPQGVLLVLLQLPGPSPERNTKQPWLQPWLRFSIGPPCSVCLKIATFPAEPFHPRLQSGAKWMSHPQYEPKWPWLGCPVTALASNHDRRLQEDDFPFEDPWPLP